jgi:anti-sigma B factor antagonist
MDFPSKEARPAARPLLRLRGVGAGRLRQRTLRQLRLLLRSGPWERLGRDGRSTPNLRTSSTHAAAVRVPMREPMMSRPPSGGFSVDDLDSETSHTLILAGELDTRAVPALEAAIARYCANESRALILDLSQLSFIDSSGLWMILAAMRWCERQGRSFSLLPGPEPVQQVFELTGLIDVLPFRGAETHDRHPGDARLTPERDFPAA